METIERLEARLTETRDAGQRLVEQIERLEARVVVLTEFLRDVARHPAYCASTNRRPDPCTCGIQAALDAAAGGA